MNIIKHHVYRLEFDTWEPFEKKTIEQLGHLVYDLKNKEVLASAGNVRLIQVSEERI